MDSSPSMNKYHFSPSNLSGDSGLISDSQYYDEDGNGNDNDPRNFARSNSHFLERNMSQEDLDQQSLSLDGQFYHYNHNNPVPPPRRPRRKGSDPSTSPNMELDRKRMSYNPQVMYGQSPYEKKYNRSAEKYKRSTESLKSVEESSEADSEMNMKNFKKHDIGTLIKSASGSHLFFEEINSPTIYEFGNMNRMNNGRGRLYKQSSEGTMPMSPKYSLCSSHDSVLSDSSGSFLNRQNSPDPLSSPANTPDQEDGGMPHWLSQQCKHAAYTSSKQNRISHDDSEVGVKVDKKANKLNYLVSPKTSPKLRRRSPIPLEARRSFPLQPQISQKGSGSNTSKEAEDIIKSPKLTITYSSQDSLDKRGFESPHNKPISPHLDVYNNNSQAAMRQLNIYSAGLQGTSPPPRVVLQGLSSQSQQRRENTPMKANHALLPQQRRNSFDSAEFIEHKQKYPMEENSVSSEDEGSESGSEVESYTRVQTSFDVPWKFNIPTKRVIEHSKSASESSSISDDTTNGYRPEQPPNYDEAVQRNKMLKQGLSPASSTEGDAETARQRETSLRAKQLFEQSQRMYQNQKEKYEQTLDAHKEILSEEETESITSSSDEETPLTAARKLYEDSLKRYQEEQTRTRSPLKKSSSEEKDNISLLKPKGGQQGYSSSLLPQSSSVQRSCSDVADLKGHLSRSSSGSSRNSSNDSTPTRRPNQPPPYNNPPPYRSETHAAESSPSDVKRHLFPRAGENLLTQNTPPQTVANTSVSKSVGALPQNMKNDMSNCSISPRRDNILISNRNRHPLNQQVDRPVRDNTTRASSTDYTVQSAQVDLSQYTGRSSVTNIRSRDSSLDSKLSPSVINVRQSMPDSVFRVPASSVEPKQPQSKQSDSCTSSQTIVSCRNPNQSDVSKSQTIVNTRTAVSSAGGQGDLPWSVKRLSGMFDTSKNGSISARSSPVGMQSSRQGAPPAYTPPPSFQRATDTIRSSTSSNSSMSSASTALSGAARTPGKTFGKFGPQARDSFSSADESDCSCRYSLNCRRDNSSLEELTDTSLTDITYV